MTVPWSRISLVLVLLGLLAWFWVLRSGKPVEVDLSAYAAPPWVMNAERVVYTSGADSIVVERRGDRFEIVHPISDHADPTRVLQALQAAIRLAPIRVLPGVDLAAFGLDPPRHRLDLSTPAGQTWSIAIGDTVPVGSRIYAHVEGPLEPNTVLLLREFGARRDFFPTADQLRDRVALPLQSPIVDSVYVFAGSYHLRAVRNSRDFWIAREPLGLELDPLPIHRAIRLLRTPMIREFLPADADPRDYGFDPPRATWITFDGARAETVRIGGVTPEADGVYVRPARRNAIGELPADTYRELVDGWPGLASRRLSYQDAASIERIEFPGTEAAYVRSDSGWVRLPEGRLVRNGPALLRDLSNLLALQWETYPLRAESPAPTAESVQVRLVPDSTAVAATPPFAPGPDLITLSANGEKDGSYARTERRSLWGHVPETALRTWSYRRSHPDL